MRGVAYTAWSVRHHKGRRGLLGSEVMFAGACLDVCRMANTTSCRSIRGFCSRCRGDSRFNIIIEHQHLVNWLNLRVL